MPAEQVVLLGVGAVGAVLLLVRAVVARGEPWWAAWPLPVGAVLVLAAVATNRPSRQVLAAGVVVAVGLVLQVAWAYRRGRYLEDDVTSLWRRVRGRPAPKRSGRHRVRDD